MQASKYIIIRQYVVSLKPQKSQIRIAKRKSHKMGNFLTFKKSMSPLLQPAIAGDINEVKKIIGYHIAQTSLESKEELASFVNRADKEGNNALIGSVFGGHLDIVKFLIEDCSAGVDVKNNIGCSSFWIACGYDHVHILEYLIQRINSMELPHSKLIQTCIEGNSSGDTPLLAACSRGNTNVVKLLLSSLGKNAFEVLTLRNKAGDTPLAVAVGAGYEGDLLKVLLDYEEKLRVEMKTSPLHLKNKLGLTPLLVACERNSANIAKELIIRGADVSITDEKGRTPLAIASFCGCMDVMDYLLSNSDAAKDLIDAKDLNGCTPLWLAARTGNLKMVKRLLEAGADSSITDIDGLSPQAAATKFKKNDVSEFFKERS